VEGVNVNLSDNSGRTPLSHAAEGYSVGESVIELLLASGADIV
jgi:hypothetical protein